MSTELEQNSSEKSPRDSGDSSSSGLLGIDVLAKKWRRRSAESSLKLAEENFAEIDALMRLALERDAEAEIAEYHVFWTLAVTQRINARRAVSNLKKMPNAEPSDAGGVS